MCGSCCLCNVWLTIWTDVILLLHSGPVGIKSGTAPEYKKAWEMGEKKEARLNNRNGVNGWLLLCVCLCTCIFVRTNLSCRPWEWVHFWKAKTFWPVLTLGQTVKGLFNGLSLVLWVNVRNGSRFSLGLRLGFGIMLVSVLTRIEVQTWWLHIWAQIWNYVSKSVSLCSVMLAFTLLAYIVLGGWASRVTARRDTNTIQYSSTGWQQT